jgi:hypothetical protein
MKRLIENYITSLFGLTIAVTANICLLKGIIDNVAYLSLMMNALILFRAKDSLLGAKAN